MKKLKNKIAFVLLFILVSAMSQAKGLDPRFQILPLPQNIEILKDDMVVEINKWLMLYPRT